MAVNIVASFGLLSLQCLALRARARCTRIVTRLNRICRHPRSIIIIIIVASIVAFETLSMAVDVIVNICLSLGFAGRSRKITDVFV